MRKSNRTGVFVTILAFFFCNSFTYAADPTQGKKAPNIVFLLMDDLDNVITRPYFNEILPKAMALKKEGVEFTEAFITTPQCCPSRAAILSGKYGHNTRVLGNGGRNGGHHRFSDDEPYTIAARLYQGGYRTLMAGKYINSYNEKDGTPWGWTDGAVLTSGGLKKYTGYNYKVYNWKDGVPTSRTKWAAGKSSIEKFGKGQEDYSTDVILGKTLEFLKDTKAKNDQQPFFAYVAPTCPHFPLPPAKRHREAAQKWGYKTFPKDRPNYFSDGKTTTDKPQWLTKTWDKRGRLKDSGGRMYHWMGGELPEDRPTSVRLGWNEVDWYNRMGSLMACDEMVDQLVSWLKANNEWENTIFVFTSDNGYNLGAHAQAQKSSPYEEALRIPLIVAGGAQTGIRKKSTDANWFLNIDFAPTLLGLAGLPVPTDMDGEDLSAVIRGSPRPVRPRTRMLVEYYGPSMAEGYMEDAITYHLQLAPGFFLDVPTYQAVRERRTVMENGKPVEKTFLFVRWERMLSDRYFRRRLRKDRKFLASRLRRQRPLAMRRFAKVQSGFDRELYDISSDPYQLSNLLHHSQGEYDLIAADIENSMHRLVNCQGSTGNQSCIDAGRNDALPSVAASD